jgi:hypothetical protein
LLWASSFTTAVYIANSSIASPDFTAVAASCESAYALAAAQKDDYVRCVESQLQQCDQDFATVLNAQVKATNAALTANAQVLAAATLAQERCSSSFTTAQVAPLRKVDPSARAVCVPRGAQPTPHGSAPPRRPWGGWS